MLDGSEPGAGPLVSDGPSCTIVLELCVSFDSIRTGSRSRLRESADENAFLNIDDFVRRAGDRRRCVEGRL